MTFEELMRLEDELNIYHLAKLIEKCADLDDQAKAGSLKKMWLEKLNYLLDEHKDKHGQERNEWLIQRLLKHALR